MNPPPSGIHVTFTPDETDLLHCVIAAPDQYAAAEWLDISAKHLRSRLRQLREQHDLETNRQLIVLASINGWTDPCKVLPFGGDPRGSDKRHWH